jgi:hypothetical protein
VYKDDEEDDSKEVSVAPISGNEMISVNIAPTTHLTQVQIIVLLFLLARLEKGMFHQQVKRYFTILKQMYCGLLCKVLLLDFYYSIIITS